MLNHGALSARERGQEVRKSGSQEVSGEGGREAMRPEGGQEGGREGRSGHMAWHIDYSYHYHARAPLPAARIGFSLAPRVLLSLSLSLSLQDALDRKHGDGYCKRLLAAGTGAHLACLRASIASSHVCVCAHLACGWTPATPLRLKVKSSISSQRRHCLFLSFRSFRSFQHAQAPSCASGAHSWPSTAASHAASARYE